MMLVWPFVGLGFSQSGLPNGTLERLTSKGMSAEDAKEKIAACLGEETDAMWRSKRGFDEKS